ncbi:MAG: LysR family transcriptional regulator [Bacteroidota bacterium]
MIYFHEMMLSGNQIELRHLQYFLAVAEELHFRKAAERLFITQPGLSRQILRLEEILGVQLFERDKRNVKLTPAGLILQEEAGELLRRTHQLIDQVRRIDRGEAGELRLGFVGSAMQSLLPGILRRMNVVLPDVHTNLEEMGNEEQIQALLADQIDLGFIRSARLPKGLNWQSVQIDSFSVVLPADHALHQGNFESVAQLRDEDFILFSRDYSHGYYDLVMSIFEDVGLTPSISHKSVHATTIFRLVESGLGVSIVPTDLQKGFQLDVRFIKLNQIPQRTTLSAVWKGENRNPILPNVLDFLPKL